jgi:hypothetical protein
MIKKKTNKKRISRVLVVGGKVKKPCKKCGNPTHTTKEHKWWRI